jgi:HEAT repeat protein
VVAFFAVRGYRAVVVRLGVLPVLLFTTASWVRGQQPSSVEQLVQQFESETEFTRQFQVAKAIVAANDRNVLPRLEPWLRHKDRCLRGNAAYIFARLGDPRGFDLIVAILGDRSADREVHFVSVNPLTGLIFGRSIHMQIRQDRYCAGHLLGELKDPRAIPILLPLRADPDVGPTVPWSLKQIVDSSSIPNLIGLLSHSDPGMRVLAIDALIELRATEALPRLRRLLNDNAKPDGFFDESESVAEAARSAIAELQ